MGETILRLRGARAERACWTLAATAAVSGSTFGACSGEPARLESAASVAPREARREAALREAGPVVVGEVREDAASFWGRRPGAHTMHVWVAGTERTAPVDRDRDFSARLTLTGLEPGRRYAYRIWFSEERRGAPGAARVTEGTVVTAPAAAKPARVRFAWGGGLGGRNACRDGKLGYPTLAAAAARRPHFFVGLGDMIHADGRCDALGHFHNAQVPGASEPARTRADYWLRWRYNREDVAFERLLAESSYYAVWDDGEIGDAWSAAGATGDASIDERFRVARQAFLDYQPELQGNGQLYRTFRWGRHLQLILLDARSHRSPNMAEDAAARPKALLGELQRRWLVEQLSSSDATWKVVACAVPIAVPTGASDAARDGWANFDGATGFERELTALWRELAERHIHPGLWITSGARGAAHFEHRPFEDVPDFVVHEVSAGPLSWVPQEPNVYDKTFGSERRFALASPGQSGYRAALRTFSYGHAAIEVDGTLEFELVDALGKRRYHRRLVPPAAIGTPIPRGSSVPAPGRRFP